MLKSYFTFTKNQSRAILFLSTCILLSIGFYFAMPYLFAQKNEIAQEEVVQLMSQITLEENDASNAGYYAKNESPAVLTPFPFDPNTLDSAGFKKLGLRDKLIGTLLHYRNKGGKFYNKESLKRIYGLHEDEYKQLEPYIAISNKEKNSYDSYIKAQNITVELNSADTALLIQLRGIGSKLAMNIVKYREQLGGFVQKEQLKEVYGISAETYASIAPYLKVNTSKVKKINLNEATLQEINRHPYLKGEMGRAIVDFRKKKNYHIDNIAELKEIELFDEKLFRKIAPYIRTQ